MEAREDSTQTRPAAGAALREPGKPPATSPEFDIPPGGRLELEGVVAALLILQDLATKAEKGLLGAVEELTPKSRPERGPPMRALIGAAAAGGDREALAAAARRLSLLLGAVLGGIPVGAEQAGEDLRTALSPEQVEAAAGPRPARCWEEFKRRWEAFTSEGMDERMRRTIGEAIAKLLP